MLQCDTALNLVTYKEGNSHPLSLSTVIWLSVYSSLCFSRTRVDGAALLRAFSYRQGRAERKHINHELALQVSVLK